MKTIGEFAADLYGAPAWLMVASVTMQEEGRPPRSVAPEDLDTVPYPDGPFTLTLKVRPSAVVRSVDGA